MGGKTEKNRLRQMTYYCFNCSVPSWSVKLLFFVCVVNAGNGKLFHFLSLSLSVWFSLNTLMSATEICKQRQTYLSLKFCHYFAFSLIVIPTFCHLLPGIC